MLFDEVSLSSGLHYNSSNDQIDGFVDSGTYKNQDYADHALVFMVRVIKKKFKQPLCYTFCQGATKQDKLACLLKEVRTKPIISVCKHNLINCFNCMFTGC